MLHEPLDRATLARGVPALEQDHDFFPALLDPALYFQQFYLQGLLFLLISLVDILP
jgi:hypothetical protein